MSFFANIRVRLPDYLDKIVRNDATGGVLMLFCTVLALVLQNGSYSTSYRHWLEMQAGVIFGDFQLIKPLLLWINDGLITIFFFSIGLELKIEFIKGHLSELRNVVMPCLGAIAGIVVPSLFFIAFNYDNAYAMRGWAIPTSTDTAFSLAIILLLGSRVPISLRVFLLSMAIFDDIGAILVIALFYTSELSAPALVSASFAIMCLLALNYFGVARKMFYLFFGVILWFSIFKSGMHATLAGIITAFCIPMQSASGEVMVERIYESLKMWVALLVLPVFTIANAGVDLSMIDLEGFLSPVSLGIFTGLFFGKQLGIFATIWLCIKLKLVQAPADATYKQIYGVCILTGIGFSMSMFIDSLAYQGSSIFEYADSLAILVASLCSGVFGYCFLRFYACRTLEIEYRPWLPAPGGYKGTASTATTYVPTEGASSVAPTAVAVAEANARAAAAAKAAQAAEEAAAAAAAAADAAKKVAEDEDDTQSVAQVQLAAAQAAAAAATAAVSSTKLDTDPDQDTNEVAAAALEAATAAADIAAEVAEAVEAEAAEAEAAEAAEAEAEEAESETEGETAESGAEESAAANEAEPSPDQSSSEPAESEAQTGAADTTSESQAEAPAGESASASAEATEAAVVSEVAEPAQGVDTTEAPADEVTPLSVDSIKPEEIADEVAPVESTETAESETKQPEAELDLALHADAVKAALEAEASGENPQQAAAAAVAASKEQEITEAQSEATTSVEAEAVTAAAATTATAATAAESAPVEDAKADKADKSEKAEKSDKTEKSEKAEAAEKTKEEKKAAKAKKADKAKEKEEKSGNDDDDFAAEYFKNVVKLAQAEVLEPHHHKAETKDQASFSSDPDASLTDAAQTAQNQVVSEETTTVAEAVAHAANATDATAEGAQAEQSPDSAVTANAEATEAQVQPDLDLALNAEAVAAAIAADEAKAQAEAAAAADVEQSADMVNFAISQEDAQEISTEVSRQVASVGENMETVDTVPARNKDIADTNFNQDFVQLNTESVTVNYSMEHASDKATEVQPEASVQQPEPIVPETLAEEPVVAADTSATTSAAPAESSTVPAESSAESVEAVATEAAEAESVAPAQDQSQAEAQPEVTPQDETQSEPEAKAEVEASEAAADAGAKTESSTWQKLTSVLKKHKD